MSTDRDGRPLADYPAEDEIGRLVGVTVFGTAVYADGEQARVALLNDDGGLTVPPRDARVADRFPYDEIGMTVGEYVAYVADEYGPWRELSDRAREAVAEHADPEAVVGTADPSRWEVAGLVTGLAGAEEWDERVEIAGELRQALLDAPAAGEPGLGTMLDLLDDVTGERERLPVEAEDPVGDQPFEERERSFPRIAARRDIAQGVARVLREVAGSDGVDERTVRRVAFLAGDRPIHDPETAYREYLVDALDLLGRRQADTVRAALRSLFDGDARERRRGVNAAYHLARRNSADHPLIDDDLRLAVEALAEDPDPGVREAVEEFQLVLELAG